MIKNYKINTFQQPLQRIFNKLASSFGKKPEKIFRKLKGVIHVGANTGQETKFYAKYNLPVVWIEPIPNVYEKLLINISEYSNQIALNCLVTDIDGGLYPFHIANNNGASSSILEFNLHGDIWPEVEFEKTISIESKTLATLIVDNNINIKQYDMLVMDTQGSELLVLQGAVFILKNFTYIKTEVPDFEAYKGCCQLGDLNEFLSHHGFKEIIRNKFASHPNGGSYYDIIYERKQD